jgi:uncharacterized membrane protein
MKKNKNGYSLAVLVITIAVILIIMSVSVVKVRTTKEDRDISRFIYAITSISEYSLDYYSSTGTMPGTQKYTTVFEQAMLSQINPEDNNIYYIVDINRLEGIKLNDYTETYIINEKTLTVYYPTGVLYKGTKYYRVTDELRGITEESTNTDTLTMNINGNPLVWRTSAILNVSVPAVDPIDMTSENGWILKWDYDKHPINYFEASGNIFTINNGIVISQNGIYTIYIENPEQKATVKYVVITKIDDINPKITWYEAEQKYRIIDNETGIAQVRCKAGDFEDAGDYLIGGSGETVEEFRERYLAAEADYNASYDLLQTRYNAGEITYDEYVILLNELESTHEYLTMKTQTYTVYVADYAENAAVTSTSADDILNKFFEF